jgi:2-polyprenyl-3-methyl-5-hydroxy-6-metoxy-1,4-benzoquinol methylase
MTVSDCFICKRKSTLLADNFSINEIDYYSTYYCKCCDFIYSKSLNSFEAKKFYDNVYSNLTKIGGYNRYPSYVDIAKIKPNKLIRSVPFYKSLINLLNEQKNKPLTVLDYGCGLGYLTKILRDLGFNSYGTDISSTAVTRAKENFNSDFFLYHDEFNSFSAEFDVIILNDTLGHVEDPLSLFSILLSKLSINGQIIINTPRKYKFQDTFDWIQVYPPDRFLFFSEASLTSLAKALRLHVFFLNKKKKGVVVKLLNNDYKQVNESLNNLSTFFKLKILIRAIIPSKLLQFYYIKIKKKPAEVVENTNDIIAIMEKL